jgi:hypothetical protein
LSHTAGAIYRIVPASAPLPKANTPNTLIPNILKVKIKSPADGQQVPTGSLGISGTSTDDIQSDCVVSVALNRKHPYQNATAAGPGGNNDYSNWTYTFDQPYGVVQPGQNRISARITCIENTNLSKGAHINVTGVLSSSNGSSSNLSQQQQAKNPPLVSSTSSSTTVPFFTSPIQYAEQRPSSATSIPHYTKYGNMGKIGLVFK